jgi:hypothetical protein
MAAHPQGSFRYLDECADLRDLQLAVEMQSQHSLEPRHDVRVSLPCAHVVACKSGGQAVDQDMDHILLEGAGDLTVCSNFRLCLGKAAGSCVQTLQVCNGRRRRSQDLTGKRREEIPPGKRLGVSDEVVRRQRYESPVA